MRKTWMWVGQGVVALAVAALVGLALRGRWDEFRSLEVGLTFRPALIVAAAATVWATYALLIEAWRRVLLGWGQPLAFRPAVRIWCISNLARYVPGKVWSIAGLALLAQRVGVSGWAAAGSAVVMQVVAVGTGAAVAAVSAPRAVSPAGVVVAVGAAAAALLFLVWPPLAGRVGRLLGPDRQVAPLPAGTALAAAAATILSWVGYGVAFWLLARGILPGPPPPLLTGVGIFAAGYLLGLLALFAPGGVGVREVVLVALLVPAIGSGPALALSVGSRLLLTVTEVGAALGALALTGGATLEDAVDARGH